MKFDITQQQPFPSLVTLFCISVLGVCALFFGEHTLFDLTISDSILGGYISVFQASHNTLSIVISTAIIFFVALRLSLVASMFNIFGATTSIHLPLLGVLLWSVVLSGEYLLSSILVLLMSLCIIELILAVRNNSPVSHIFNASLWLSLLPFLYNAAVGLWVAVPLILIFIGATWREWVASLSALIVAAGGISYIYWLTGEDIEYVGERILEILSSPTFEFNDTIMLFRVVILLLTVVLSLLSLLWFGSGVPRTRARLNIIFTLFVVTLSTVVIPSSSPLSLVIAAPMIALLTTLAMVRMRGGVVNIIYFSLLTLLLLAIFTPLYLPLEQLISLPQQLPATLRSLLQ